MRILMYMLRSCEWASYRIHNAIFNDYKQSLCSRAYWLHTMYPFWRVWTIVFGRKHCERAYKKHWRK